MNEAQEKVKVECSACGDTGIEFLICCDGSMCGCMGYPYRATKCKCGIKPSISKLSAHDREVFKRVEWIGHD